MYEKELLNKMARLIIIDDSPVKLKGVITSFFNYFKFRTNSNDLKIILCNVIHTKVLGVEQKEKLNDRHSEIDKIFKNIPNYKNTINYVDIAYHDYKDFFQDDLNDKSCECIYQKFSKDCERITITNDDNFLIDMNLDFEDEERLNHNKPVFSYALYKSLRKKLNKNHIHMYSSYNEANMRDQWITNALKKDNDSTIDIYSTELFEGDGFNEIYANEVLSLNEKKKLRRI